MDRRLARLREVIAETEEHIEAETQTKSEKVPPSKWAMPDDTTRLPSRLSLTEMVSPGRRDSPSSSIASGRSTPLKNPSHGLEKSPTEEQPQCRWYPGRYRYLRRW